MSTLINVKDDAAVRLITINRPEKKNALKQEMYAGMISALTAANSSPHIRACVITGSGEYFTSGNDLADFAAQSGDGGATPAAEFPRVLATMEKPILVAVNGPAVGVGVTMLLQCDLAYAADSATFRAPFVDLALVPEGASGLLAPTALGTMKANQLLLLAETWGAAEAANAGLVAGVFAKSILLDEVMARAHKIAAKAPAAMRASKALLGHNRAQTLAFIEHAHKIFSDRIASEEFAEAASAFMIRRPADFSRFT